MSGTLPLTPEEPSSSPALAVLRTREGCRSSAIPRPSYRVDEVLDGRICGEYVVRTSPEGLVVQRLVEPVGENQCYGTRVGNAYLPNQDCPITIGQQGIDDRDIDPVEVYVAGIGDRTGLPGYLQICFLGEPSSQRFPERVVRGD